MISILFFFSEFWLENGVKTYTFIKSLGTIGSESKFAIDQDLLEPTKETNQCIGIVFYNDGDNKIITLTSWKCDLKKQFLCSLDVVQFTPPTAKAKLPCMPSQTRKKRDDGTERQEDILEDGRMIYKKYAAITLILLVICHVIVLSYILSFHFHSFKESFKREAFKHSKIGDFVGSVQGKRTSDSKIECYQRL